MEKQTLVFYMGLNQAPAIREKLIAHGMAEDMPAAIVENGTAVTQKVVSGTLGQLDILAQQMASPALIIVGRVVGLRDKLNWFSRPLTLPPIKATGSKRAGYHPALLLLRRLRLGDKANRFVYRFQGLRSPLRWPFPRRLSSPD